MLPQREYRIALHGIELAVAEWGQSDAPPLLMLHGWLDNAATFSSLMPILSRHFRCIALDLPGHGKSDHLPGTVNYHFLDGVQHIFEACDELSLNPVTIVGHSMGGALGMLYAGAFPDRVHAFVSIESFGPLVRAAQETASQFASAVLDHVKRRESRKRTFATVDEALAIRASVADCSAEVLRPIVERNLNAVKNGGYQWRSDARLRLPSLLRMSPEQSASFFRAITAPVLVIAADKGLRFVADALERDGKLVRALHQTQLSGGHHIHLERPEEVANLIVAFLHS